MFVNAVASGAAPPEQRQVLLMDSLVAVSRLRRQRRRRAGADVEPRVQMLGSLFQSLDAVLLEPVNRSEEEIAGLTQDDLLLWRIGMAYPKVLARVAAFMPDVSFGEMEAQAVYVGSTVFLRKFRRRRNELDRRPNMNKARATLVRSPLYKLGSQEMLLEAAAVALTVFPSLHPQTQYAFAQLMDEERDRRRRESQNRTAEVRSFDTVGEVIQGYWQKIWKSPLPGSPAAQAARWRSLALSLTAMAELVRAEAEDFPPARVPVDGSEGVVRRVSSPQVAADSNRFAGMVNDLVHAYHYQYRDDKEAIKKWSAGAAQKGDGQVMLPSNQVIPDHGLMELAYRLLGEVSDDLTPPARRSILDMIEDRGCRERPFRIPRPGVMKMLGVIAGDEILAARATRVQGQLLAEAALEMVLNAPLTVARTPKLEAGTQWGAAHVLFDQANIERDPIGFEMKFGDVSESLAIGLEAAGERRHETYAQFLHPFLIYLAGADVLARQHCQDKQRELVPDPRFHLPAKADRGLARVGKNPIDGVLAELAFFLTRAHYDYTRSCREVSADGESEGHLNAMALYQLVQEMIAASDRFPDSGRQVINEIFGGGAAAAAPDQAGKRDGGVVDDVHYHVVPAGGPGG
jgi:hypothetical protein